MYKALISFSGVISMHKGEVKAITDKAVIADLVSAGYIEPLEKKKKPKPQAEAKPKKAAPKKAKK